MLEIFSYNSTKVDITKATVTDKRINTENM